MNRLSSLEIDTLERVSGVVFPEMYRKLLTEKGWGEFLNIEIYHPTQIRELYQYHFENEGNLFGTYFPFGCNNAKQEIWLIRSRDGLAASVWHETHPDDYDQENWLGCGEWLIRHEALLSTHS